MQVRNGRKITKVLNCYKIELTPYLRDQSCNLPYEKTEKTEKIDYNSLHFPTISHQPNIEYTSDRAARSRIRFDSDLDPGNVIVPEISLMGCNTISGTVDGFSAVATEAQTLNVPTLPPPTTLTCLCFKVKDFDEPKNCDPKESELRDLGFWVLGLL